MILSEFDRIRSEAEAAIARGASETALAGLAALRLSGHGTGRDLFREIGLLARLRRTDELFRLATSEFDLLCKAPDGLTLVARALRGSATLPATERQSFFARALAAEPTNTEALIRLVEAKLATEDLAGARQLIAASAEWAEPAILAQLRAIILQAEGDLGAALREAALAQRLARLPSTRPAFPSP